MIKLTQKPTHLSFFYIHLSNECRKLRSVVHGQMECIFRTYIINHWTKTKRKGKDFFLLSFKNVSFSCCKYICRYCSPVCLILTLFALLLVVAGITAVVVALVNTAQTTTTTITSTTTTTPLPGNAAVSSTKTDCFRNVFLYKRIVSFKRFGHIRLFLH
jgi:hypothetical protein